MNVSPHIYVVIPVYNCEKFLETAVMSVIEQPYKEIDIVLVNDGSKDGSSALCDQLKERFENFHVIHQENRGVSAARNAGIEYILSINPSNEDYIAFLDSDDLWAKNCLTDDVFDNSDQDLICFLPCDVSEDLKKCALYNIHDFGNIVYGGAKSIWKYYWNFGSIFYNVKIFKSYDLRFDTSLKYAEDQIFMMQSIYLANEIKEIAKVLYLYRMQPNSAMHVRPHGINYFVPMIHGWLRSDEKMKQYYTEERGELKGGRITALSRMVSMAQEHYMYFGKKKELYSALKELEIYQDFLSFSPPPERRGRYKEYFLLRDRPYIFMIKYYTKGFVFRVYHKLVARFFKRSLPLTNTFLD